MFSNLEYYQTLACLYYIYICRTSPHLGLYSHLFYFARFSVCLCARWVPSPHRLDLFSTAPTPAVRNLLHIATLYICISLSAFAPSTLWTYAGSVGYRYRCIVFATTKLILFFEL